MSFENVFKIEHDSTVCQLHHKTKMNSVINVVCEAFDEVTEPSFDNEKKIWVIPSDIVGLDSKKSKIVKIRYHPRVIEFCKVNEEFHQAACSSGLQYLDFLLDESEWTRKKNQDQTILQGQLSEFCSLVSQMTVYADFKEDCLEITWIPNKNFENLTKIVSCKTFCSKLLIRSEKKKSNVDVFLSFENLKERIDLIKIELDSTFVNDVHIPIECNFIITKTAITWVALQFQPEFPHSPPKVSDHVSYAVFINKEPNYLSIISSYATISTLCEALSMSLQTSPSHGEQLIRVPNLTSEAIIGLDKNESQSLAKFISLINSTPLMINTDLSEITVESELSWSPTDSIDSGISLSPTRSIDEPFESSPIPRERSSSESIFNSSPKPKGILKNTGRRNPRSYSECHGFDSSDSSLLSIYPTFLEDDEDCDPFNDELNDEPMKRKKTVSFSERVEKRLFKSNTSIEAQKRKNQKKNEKKKKRDDTLLCRCSSLDENIEDNVARRMRQLTL